MEGTPGSNATPEAATECPVPENLHKVILGCPGPNYAFGAIEGIIRCSRAGHSVEIANSGTGWDDFNAVYCTALNAAEQGRCTHFAMLHSDIVPDHGWLDVLLAEMDATGAHLVSAVAPIKDRRGVTSTGIGNPKFRWGPFRRFTVRELEVFPETFNADDAGYPGGILLHNTGCWVADLRKPEFFATDEQGHLRASFCFPRRITRELGLGNVWTNTCESEDWYYSRELHDLGCKTYVTRKVKLFHKGSADYPNQGNWGSYLHGDDDTRMYWDPEGFKEMNAAMQEHILKTGKVPQMVATDIVSGVRYPEEQVAEAAGASK